MPAQRLITIDDRELSSAPIRSEVRLLYRSVFNRILERFPKDRQWLQRGFECRNWRSPLTAFLRFKMFSCSALCLLSSQDTRGKESLPLPPSLVRPAPNLSLSLSVSLALSLSLSRCLTGKSAVICVEDPRMNRCLEQFGPAILPWALHLYCAATKVTSWRARKHSLSTPSGTGMGVLLGALSCFS